MREHRSVRLHQRRWLWMAWLLLAVLLAQTSALMHRVSHGSGGPVRMHSVAALPHAAIDLTALWGEHGKPTDCQLLDDLAHATPPIWTASLDATPLAQTPPQALWTSALTQPLRAYRAQAPPLSV